MTGAGRTGNVVQLPRRHGSDLGGRYRRSSRRPLVLGCPPKCSARNCLARPDHPRCRSIAPTGSTSWQITRRGCGGRPDSRRRLGTPLTCQVSPRAGVLGYRSSLLHSVCHAPERLEVGPDPKLEGHCRQRTAQWKKPSRLWSTTGGIRSCNPRPRHPFGAVSDPNYQARSAYRLPRSRPDVGQALMARRSHSPLP